MLPDPVRAFYDSLADDYALIYADWEASVGRQAAALDRLIRGAVDREAPDVLDCAAGIGTQSLGLLALGHQVISCDSSPAALRRAQAAAELRNLDGTFAAADMRHLPFAPESFDVILCADNALPHLLDLPSLSEAAAAMARAARPEALLIASVRDYDRDRATRPRSTLPTFTQTRRGRVITFQLWDWHDDGEHYDLEHFQVFEEPDGRWTANKRATTYWALSREQLQGALVGAGWVAPTWYEPGESGFFQPIIAARRG